MRVLSFCQLLKVLIGYTLGASNQFRFDKKERSLGMRKMLLGVGLGLLALGANAQTEANAIITQVESSFDLLVPVAVSIATFFVVLRLAKRVVK